MLAYVFWHRPAAGADTEDYEATLRRFHSSLAHSPPAGLRGSATLRADELEWLPGEGPAYEDWYCVESWAALGVLEKAAVSRGHESAHREAARHVGAGAAAVYKLIEGELDAGHAHLAVWVSTPNGQTNPRMVDLLDDGVAPEAGALWQRALVLGPAPEFCLLHAEAELPAGSGLSAGRLPTGWRERRSPRSPLER